jgi:hypothetical protein
VSNRVRKDPTATIGDQHPDFITDEEQGKPDYQVIQGLPILT